MLTKEKQCGSFGFELKPSDLTPEESAAIPSILAAWKEINPIVITGHFYRLRLHGGPVGLVGQAQAEFEETMIDGTQFATQRAGFGGALGGGEGSHAADHARSGAAGTRMVI